MNLHQLAKAFVEYHAYDKVDDYNTLSVEKTTEEVPEGVEVIETDIELLKEIIGNYYNGN